MPQYTNASMVPMGQDGSMSQNQNIMGPPQRPADRQNKDAEYDVNDSLAGTGIDIRAEEQYMSELYATTLTNYGDARSGFAVGRPGPASSFYGAGPANQPAIETHGNSQDEIANQVAERAWREASMRLATQRTQEISDPFLQVSVVHYRADKIAKENQLDLNLEVRNGVASMGKMRGPEYFVAPSVSVQMKEEADGAMTLTSGSWIPQEAYLVDQLALLSIATKFRLRELIEDANLIATTRQKTSHGDIPEEWAPAAGPMNAEPLLPLDSDGPRNEDGSLKRGADGIDGPAGPARPAKLPKVSCYMTTTMRDLAKQEREWEEARLRRRQNRKGTIDGAMTPAKPLTTAPSTPGSVAPEGEKPLTKREMNKRLAAKAAEVTSHNNQNITSGMFAGLGRSSLFGKKNKSKTYDWMNAGRGSGTSTPNKAPGGERANGMGDSSLPTTPALTREGRNRLGGWREDKNRGKDIQLRDWVKVLENDGREGKALQQAYMALEESNPK